MVLGRGLGIAEIIEPHRVRLLELTRDAGAEGFWVFGSVRRREANRASDVDFLITWKHPISLLKFAALVDDLEGELGRPVELVDRESLHWAMAPQVLAEALPV